MTREHDHGARFPSNPSLYDSNTTPVHPSIAAQTVFRLLGLESLRVGGVALDKTKLRFLCIGLNLFNPHLSLLSFDQDAFRDLEVDSVADLSHYITSLRKLEFDNNL